MTRQPGLEPSSLEGLSTWTWEASEGGALKNLAAWTLGQSWAGVGGLHVMAGSKPHHVTNQKCPKDMPRWLWHLRSPLLFGAREGLLSEGQWGDVTSDRR